MFIQPIRHYLVTLINECLVHISPVILGARDFQLAIPACQQRSVRQKHKEEDVEYDQVLNDSERYHLFAELLGWKDY